MPKSSAEPMLGHAPPPRRTRPRDRRDQILRAAGDIFSEKGFHAASLASIARQVGITPAALYRHFPSKQQLLGQVLLSGLGTTLAQLDRVPMAEPGGADERLSWLMDFALEYRGLPRLWQLEVRNLTDEDRAKMLELVRRLIAIIDDSIRHRRPDLAPDDSIFLAWVTVSIATSTSYHNVQLSKERSRRLLATLIDAVLSTKFAATAPPAPVSPSHPGVTDDDVQPERLVVAAAKLFNTRGYAAVAIEDIGAAVGISGPAIYHHFESKADLLNEIIRRNEEWIGHYISRACEEGESPDDSLVRLMAYTIAFVSRSPDIAGTALSEARHLPDDESKRYRRVHRNGVLRWVRLLQAAHPEIPEDEARVQVQAITTVIIDAVRNIRLTSRPDFVGVLNDIGNRIAFAQTLSTV